MNTSTHSRITIAIMAVFMTSQMVYADSDKSDTSNQNVTQHTEVRAANEVEEKKITICHVPPGNPENKHTIHIAFSAWPAHKNNHDGDYLGSCNNPPRPIIAATNTTHENLVVIKDCKGDYRSTLITLTQAYFSPIIVKDTAFDDEAVAFEMGDCLNQDDSSDSGTGYNAQQGLSSLEQQGDGYDQVTDDGHHHLVRNCKNKGNGDFSRADRVAPNDLRNHHAALQKANTDYRTRTGTPNNWTLITDSSLDDSGSDNRYASNVYTEYKRCVSDSSDTSKVRKNQGDSGHHYRLAKDCANDAAIHTAADAHHRRVQDAAVEKYRDLAIVLTQSSLADTVIHTAVADCLDPNKGQGTQSIVSADPNHAEGYADFGYSGRLNQLERNTVKPHH